MEADDNTNALVGTWRNAHVDNKISARMLELAKSPIAHMFKDLDLDVLRTKYGTIVASERKGEVDYERMAREQLGPAYVEELKERYRKPSSKGPRALESWAAELGLPG